MVPPASSMPHPAGQAALPNQEKPILCITTSHFYMPTHPRKGKSLHILLSLTHKSQLSVVAHHHCTPFTSSSVIPLATPQQYLALLGLLVLFSLQRSSAEDWQKLSLVSLAGGREFLARENQWIWASCPEWVHTWLTTAGNSLISGQISPTAQQNPWETASFHMLTILKQTETLMFMTVLHPASLPCTAQPPASALPRAADEWALTEHRVLTLPAEPGGAKTNAPSGDTPLVHQYCKQG